MTNLQTSDYLEDARNEFRKYKVLAERAIAQVDDETFFALIDADANSIAILVKHMAGNMRSRWRDFLTSDGEKADRHRDQEFIITETDTRSALMQAWEENWQLLFAALAPLTADDLGRTITIRDEPHSVLVAVNRQLTHYAYHVGQIVLLAKHARAVEWQTLSIARGESEQYNARMRGQ